eukprot:Pgem_evm2s15282
MESIFLKDENAIGFAYQLTPHKFPSLHFFNDNIIRNHSMYDPIVSVEYSPKVVTQSDYYKDDWLSLFTANPNDKLKFNYDTFSLTFEHLVNMSMRWSGNTIVMPFTPDDGSAL